MSGMTENPPRRPLLDMTPEGEFREAPRPGGPNLFVARVGGIAMLVAIAAAGLLVVALSIFFVALLLPIVLGAGAIAAMSIWWRRRQLRKMGIEPGPIRIVVRR